MAIVDYTISQLSDGGDHSEILIQNLTRKIKGEPNGTLDFVRLDRGPPNLRLGEQFLHFVCYTWFPARPSLKLFLNSPNKSFIAQPARYRCSRTVVLASARMFSMWPLRAEIVRATFWMRKWFISNFLSNVDQSSFCDSTLIAFLEKFYI